MTPILKQMSFLFKCAEQDGDERIRVFIQKAFDWYCKVLESTEDHTRYLYTTVVSEDRRSKPSDGWGDDEGEAVKKRR